MTWLSSRNPRHSPPSSSAPSPRQGPPSSLPPRAPSLTTVFREQIVRAARLRPDLVRAARQRPDLVRAARPKFLFVPATKSSQDMTTPSHRLSHDLVARIVTEWRERLASTFYLSINTNCRPHEFAPTWSTLSFKRNMPFSVFATASEAVAPLLVLREAIEIWHAVSCCPGFGFDENPTFWEHVLQLKFESSRPTVPLATTETFPIVLIHWDPRFGFFPYRANGDVDTADGDSPVWSLGFHLRAYFGMLGGNLSSRSIHYQENLQEIGPFQSPRVKTAPIRVKLRFTVEKNTHGALLAWLDADYQAIYAHLQSPPPRSLLKPAVMLLGLQLVVKAAHSTLHLKWLHQLLARMPEPIPVEFVSHPLASAKVMVQRGIMPLLENVMGKSNGYAGRLELLDLTSGLDLVNLGAVCSLLPHSRSIVEVRLKPQNRLGWLWVVYAMFYPSSQRTKWARICLEDQSDDSTSLQVMRCFLGSRNGAEVIQCIATKMTPGEYPPAPDETESSGTPRGYVIHTATLTKRTRVYAANDPPPAHDGDVFLTTAAELIVSQAVLAILPKDMQVELAEDDTSDLPENVHVIVPGCGLGIVPKAHLKQITTQEYPGRRASCITALYYHSNERNKAITTEILQELLPGIRDVRVHPPQAFLERSMPQDSDIESISCYQFTAQSLEWMQRLHRLHSLGLSCTSDQLHELLSAIRSAFTGHAARTRTPLRALRLTVEVPHTSIDLDWKTALTLLSTMIQNDLKSLRVFEIAFRKDCPPDDLEVEQFKARLPSSQPGLAIGKLTFLWALRTWRPQCVAALDSHVLAMIFGFCGRSVERVVVTRLPLDWRLSLRPRNEAFY